MLQRNLLRQPCRRFACVACALATLLIVLGVAAYGQKTRIDVLHVGNSGTLASERGAKEKAALETLQSFINSETGLNNDIVREKDWRELADKLASKKMHIGGSQRYEFASAPEKHSNL